MVCPITSRVKGYPFEVSLPHGSKLAGVVLADQLRSLDWRARRAERVGSVAREVMAEVLARLAPLLNF